jgi:hypothetical protein
MIRIVDYPTILFIFLFVTYATALEIGFRLASRGREKEIPTCTSKPSAFATG